MLGIIGLLVLLMAIGMTYDSIANGNWWVALIWIAVGLLVLHAGHSIREHDKAQNNWDKHWSDED